MNRQVDADRLLESWLADGPTELPDRAVDNILRQLEQTNQRKHVWLPGRERMNRMMLAVGGVAAVVVAVAATAFYFGNPNGLGFGNPPTPSPTPTPTALQSGVVNAGRFFADANGHRFTFTVPAAGWDATVSATDWALGKGDHVNTPPDFGGLFLWDPLNGLYTQPCHWAGTFVNRPNTAAEFATALAALTGFNTTPPTDVTVGGYHGKRLQLTVPTDAIMTGCQQNEYRSIEGRYYQLQGQVDDIRIIDIDGAPLMIRTTYDPNTSAATRTELEQMVDSMEIARVP